MNRWARACWLIWNTFGRLLTPENISISRMTAPSSSARQDSTNAQTEETAFTQLNFVMGKTIACLELMKKIVTTTPASAINSSAKEMAQCKVFAFLKRTSVTVQKITRWMPHVQSLDVNVLTWIRIGNFDCPLRQDEQNCSPHTCPKSQFKCDNGKCIQAEWVCDGKEFSQTSCLCFF